MTRDEALKKVLKCLRLAASSNPHEAAAALRHARKLMQEHGLDEADAYASEVRSAEARTRSQGAMLPQSLVLLTTIIGDGFRCEVVIRMNPATRSTVVQFFGANSDAQIAAYAFDVLRRQLDKDRAAHTRRVRNRANKAARGEEFAIGWVSAVARQFEPADLSHDLRAALVRARDAASPGAKECAGRDLRKAGQIRDHDFGAGWQAGARARVNPGVGGAGMAKLEHEP